MTTYTIQGVSITTISSDFIKKINEPGVQPLGNAFFEVHDCIHWFTGLGVSIDEERIIADIQFYMMGTSTKVISQEAKHYIAILEEKGVYEEIKEILIDSRKAMFAGI